MKPDWILRDSDSELLTKISENTKIDKAIIKILHSRGIKEEDEIIRFLYPELNDMHSPFLLHGIYEAVERLKSALVKGEKIALFGDSDLDGITSLSIIYSILDRGGSNPYVRYPKEKESYGLTKSVIDEFINEGVNLVITVDSGIRDLEEIEYARINGIDFIVTDHHEPDEKYPDAIIINPKKSECLYPFKELAGVGVAFKFIQAFLYSYTSGYNVDFILIYKNGVHCSLVFIKNGLIFKELMTDTDGFTAILITEIKKTDYIVLLNDGSRALSAIIRSVHSSIIITDIKKIASTLTGNEYASTEKMMEKLSVEFGISEYNRNDELSLFRKVFIELQWRGLPKILSILKSCIVQVAVGTIADIMPLKDENRQIVKYGLSMINRGEGHHGILSLAGKSKITSKTISWEIAPLLNAPGRMGETDVTVNFFLEKDISKVQEIITDIQRINRERRKLVSDIIEKINSNDVIAGLDDNIFFYMDDEIIDGLAGLIANRLADRLKKPVIIATGTDEKGYVKGSGRCAGGFDFFSCISTVSEMFVRVGGHAQAFGFTAEKNKISEIVDAINQNVKGNYKHDSSMLIDAEIEIEDINTGFISRLSLLEPYGKNNEEPVFLLRDTNINGFNSFGNAGNHGKYVIEKNINVIGWNMYEIMDKHYSEDKKLDLIFRLENNEYMGRVYPRMILVDLDFSD